MGSQLRHNAARLWRLGSSVIKCAAVAHLIPMYFWEPSEAKGPSMLPSLPVLGTAAIIDRRYRLGRSLQVGDMVVVLKPDEPDTQLCKRVVGMPGDYVLTDTPQSGSKSMIQLPPGHCYVVGDNLPKSRDSRHYGAIPLGLVRGKVSVINEDGFFTVMGWKNVDNSLKPADEDL